MNIGEVYFIGERDRSTGKLTENVKIGMVVIGSDLIVKKDMDSVQYTLERLKRESDGLEATFTQITESLLGTTPKPEEETK